MIWMFLNQTPLFRYYSCLLVQEIQEHHVLRKPGMFHLFTVTVGACVKASDHQNYPHRFMVFVPSKGGIDAIAEPSTRWMVECSCDPTYLYHFVAFDLIWMVILFRRYRPPAYYQHDRHGMNCRIRKDDFSNTKMWSFDCCALWWQRSWISLHDCMVEASDQQPERAVIALLGLVVFVSQQSEG